MTPDSRLVDFSTLEYFFLFILDAPLDFEVTAKKIQEHNSEILFQMISSFKINIVCQLSITLYLTLAPRLNGCIDNSRLIHTTCSLY